MVAAKPNPYIVTNVVAITRISHYSNFKLYCSYNCGLNCAILCNNVGVFSQIIILHLQNYYNLCGLFRTACRPTLGKLTWILQQSLILDCSTFDHIPGQNWISDKSNDFRSPSWQTTVLNEQVPDQTRTEHSV